MNKPFIKNLKSLRLMIVVLLLLILMYVSVSAHDYWFAAGNFFPHENEQVKVHMLVGTRLVVEEERPLQSKRTVFLSSFRRKLFRIFKKI